MSLKNDSLFRLIQSMSPKEQNEFLKHLQSHTGSNTPGSYQQLFKKLCSILEYNERKVKADLKNSISGTSFPVIKNNLFEKVLNFLNSKEALSGSRYLHQLLDELEVLYKRGLFLEAKMTCDKIIAEAYHQDYRHFIFEANRWRTFIAQRTTYKNIQQELNQIIQHSICNVQEMEQSLKIAAYYFEVMGSLLQYLNLRNSAFQKQIRVWMAHPYFKIPLADARLGFYTSCYLAMTKSVLYKLNGNFELSYKMEKIVWMKISKDWEFFFQYKRQECIASMCNYMEAISKTQHWNEYKKQLQFIEKILSQKKGDDYMESYYMLYKFHYLLKNPTITLTKTNLKEFEAYYEKFKNLPFLDNLRYYEDFLSFAYYQIGNYARAIEIQRDIINGFERTDIRPDQYEAAKMAYFMYKFISQLLQRKKGEEMLGFVSEINSYYEHIRKKPKEDDYRVETILVKLFRKFCTSATNKSMGDILDSTEKELNNLLAKPSPYLKLSCNNFDYKEWITRCKSHLQRV